MNTHTFKIQTDVDNEAQLEVKNEIHNQLRAFNQAVVGSYQLAPISMSVRDENDKIVGGVSGGVFLMWLVIETLWISEEARRKGLGTQLMDAIEQAGKDLGATRAFLDTMAFQAEPFYHKRGYTEFGRIPDFVNGFDRIYLLKHLA